MVICRQLLHGNDCAIKAISTRAALNYSARMSPDAFLSEALYEADKSLENFAAALQECDLHVYKMANGADSELQM